MKVTPKTNQLYNSTYFYNILKGGAGSGKSVGATQVEIRKAYERVERVLFVRKVARTLRHSVFQLIKDILTASGFIKGTHYEYNLSDMTFMFPNGSMFWLAGLDDVDKLKSIAGITRIVVEEADQIEETDLTQLDLRVRGQQLVNPQITMMFNPVSASHWLKKRFFDNKDPNALIIESNYLDNPFLDENYKARLANLINVDKNKHRIYVLNEWGIEDQNKLFARDFDREKHVGITEYDPSQDIYLSFDLNYDPTAIVIQAYDKKIRVLREYHRIGDTLPVVLNEFRSDYPGAFVIVNGDASGNHSRNITDNSTSYDIIKNILGITYDLMNVPKANPSHVRSRQVTNLLLRHWDVLIDPGCKELITDIESALVDDRQSLDPWKIANPTRSHWLDAWRYHLYAEHSNIIKDLDF